MDSWTSRPFSAILLAALSGPCCSCSTDEEERLQCFDVVCRTIEGDYYDAELGGVDWTA